MPDNIPQLYQDRIDRYSQEERPLDDRNRLLSVGRAIVFCIGAVTIGIAVRSGATGLSFAALFTLGVVPFLALILYHERLRQRLTALRERRRINENLLARKERRWSDMRLLSVAVPGEHAAITEDLDLHGRGSVFHLVCQANTPRGIQILQDWMLNPADPAETLNRQAAVKELTPEIDLREELDLRGRLLRITKHGPAEFVAWAEGESWLARRPWLIWASRATLLITLGLLIAWWVGINPAAVAYSIIAIIAFNIVLAIFYTGKLHDIFDTVSSTSGQVRHYMAIFQLLRSLKFTSSKLVEAHDGMADRRKDALASLTSLNSLMTLPNIRHSALAYVLLYLPLQYFGGWDFHCLWLLERWKKKHGKHVRQWFEALGEFEALASLSSVAHDQPEWTYPKIDAAETKVVSVELAHPLLKDDVRVANDVSVGPPGKFLLVTGSNMSGKSTLLRSLGINLVLGQMGSVVCCKSLTAPPLTVTTSIHVQDSLADGVSFYMAELRRLKQIVDQSTEFESRDDRRLFFLLDEILQGTNSQERHIAVERVLSYLVAHGAIGAATTHDLELASSNVLTDHCDVVHFRETLNTSGDEQMTFDYQMHEGVATTTNALKLLELVGLPTESTT